MTKEKIQSIAFMIIANSGDAFNHYYKAIDYAIDEDIEKAQNELELGNKSLNQAHISQAELLSAEANKERIPYSLIMSHAQDHLTMSILLSRQAKQYISLCKKIFKIERK